MVITVKGQKAESNYLVKPICEYNISDNDEASKIRYNHCEKIYTVAYPLKEVWNHYTTLNTKEAWNSQNAQFILSYDINKDEYGSALSAEFDSLKVNKVYLLELHFLKVLKLPVIFQITKVDSASKTIQFTYMRENRSNGFQTLEFSEADGITYIKHSSYFNSKSRFRDKYLYPTFHEVATDDFHEHMFKLLDQNRRPIPFEENLVSAEDGIFDITAQK